MAPRSHKRRCSMQIYAFCPRGYDGILIRVEVEVRRGIPGIDLVGLPDSALRESRERIRAAMRRSGFPIPRQRVLLNLSPASVRKEGSGYDLALALAILSATGQLIHSPEGPVLAMGELELSGKIIPAPGMESAMEAARGKDIRDFFLPHGVSIQPTNDIELWPLRHLRDLADLSLVQRSTRSWLPAASMGPQVKNPERLGVQAVKPEDRADESSRRDRVFLPGPEVLHELTRPARFALAITLAGGHHSLLLGPPGTGKSTFLRTIPRCRIPAPSGRRQEILRVYSRSGLEPPTSMFPTRTPQADSSFEVMFGRPTRLRPGELSLAHGGYLLIEELAEFGPKVLTGLRLAMEDCQISINGTHLSTVYPAEFTLCASANLCPCGARGRSGQVCLCDPRQLARHWSRIGAAFADRFDIRLLYPLEEEANLPGWVDHLEDLTERLRSVRTTFDQMLTKGNLESLPGRIPGVRLEKVLGKDAARIRAGLETSPSRGERDFTSLGRLVFTLRELDGNEHSLEEYLEWAKNLRNPKDDYGYLREMMG